MASRAAQTVIRFIEAINRNDKQEILSYFDDESIFHNIPMRPAVGRDEIWRILSIPHEACSDVDWHLHAIAESPQGVVLTERTDRYLVDGAWIEYPLMGSFEIRPDDESTFSSWRDYFDLQQCSQQTFAHARPERNLLSPA